MKLSRRDFLRWSSLSAVGAVACNIFREGEMNIQSPGDMPEDLVTGQDNWYATLCGQCPEREGLLVRVMEGRAKKVRGNPRYPTNAGKQSARCEAGLQALYHPDRIAKPLLRIGPRGSGQYEEIEWDRAMDMVVEKLRSNGDPGALLMVTEPMRGHLGLVASRFVNAYGGRHLAFQPMEEAPLRSAVQAVFGQERLPDLDIDNASYVLSFGADFTSTWLSPVRLSRGLGQLRSHDNGGRGGMVHADPRYSTAAASADEWIPVLPGREGILALSIAYSIISQGLAANPAVALTMTGGAGASALEAFSPSKVSDAGDPNYVGIPSTIRDEPAADLINRVAHDFATRRPGLAIGGGEAGAHTNGHASLSAIYALNYLVGSVARRPGEGGIIFNPRPPIEALVPVQPTASVSDWNAVAGDLAAGRVKILMVHGANPVYGLSALSQDTRFGQALESAGDGLFMVGFSGFLDDTTLMADLVLPVRAPLEEWGDDLPEPGPGYEVLGVQQPVVNPLPDLDPRSFPDLLLTISQGLQLDDGLPDTFQQVLRQGTDQLFNLGRGTPTGGSGEAPNKQGFWNNVLQQGGWWDEAATSSEAPPAPPNLAVLSRGRVAPSFRDAPLRLDNPGQKEFYLVPFLSNSLLDGRGAHLPWLQAAPDPLTTVTWQTWIEINAHEAQDMGLKEGDEVVVRSTEGFIRALVYPHPGTPPGVVSVPMGQGHTPGIEYATRDQEVRGANPMTILAPLTDEETGSLAWAATKVVVEKSGRNLRVSKFEGIVPAFPIGVRDEDIVQVTRGD